HRLESCVRPLAPSSFSQSLISKLVFMGTSSNWSFGRRVLAMTHERLTGEELPPDNLLFHDDVYDFGWNGVRSQASSPDNFDDSVLPTPDFAVYLINAVKFHCGGLFYLYDEDSFMNRMSRFHENPTEYSQRFPLWYVQYLLILAFGKAFATLAVKSHWPAGIELFTQAMKVMPDLTFFDADPLELIQVLCCKALYLQCLNRRSPAHRTIGNALRLALENGLHTEMYSPLLDADYVRKCQIMWWNIYILERQMSSLQGIPAGIPEECISTPFPPMAGSALKIQVHLSQILSKIDQTVYGAEGKIGSRYLEATRSVLRDIAGVAEQVNSAFNIQTKKAFKGISRVAAHIHLLQHQCIIMSTRPLLYIFLQARLDRADNQLMRWLQSESITGLLNICVESSQQIIRILWCLLDQGLLETFLPFDLDAAFSSTIAILMSKATHSSLVQDHGHWIDRAYTIISEMSSRGSVIAGMIKGELKHVDSNLQQLLSSGDESVGLAGDIFQESGCSDEAPVEDSQGDFESSMFNSSDLQYELSAEQLISVADALDMDSLAWMDSHDAV
ncbi:unnamed protein product, partial [Clonostachys byssicola]